MYLSLRRKWNDLFEEKCTDLEEHCSQVSNKFLNYFTGRLKTILKQKVNDPVRFDRVSENWTNNNCESVSHTRNSTISSQFKKTKWSLWTDRLTLLPQGCLAKKWTSRREKCMDKQEKKDRKSWAHKSVILQWNHYVKAEKWRMYHFLLLGSSFE